MTRNWNQLPHPPVDEWIKKMWYIYTMLTVRSNEIMKLAGKRLGLNNSNGKKKKNKTKAKILKTNKKQGTKTHQDLERQIWYVFIYMQMLAVKPMIRKLQSVEPKRLCTVWGLGGRDDLPR